MNPSQWKDKNLLKTQVRLVARSSDEVTRSVVDCILFSLVRYLAPLLSSFHEFARLGVANHTLGRKHRDVVSRYG